MIFRSRPHAISLAIMSLLATLAGAAHADDTRRPYIVQLADQPVASYSGGIAGLPATRPSAGSRLMLASPAVQQYADYLDQKRASVQAVIANAQISYEYKMALNGFAAMLTDDEVRALQANPGVASIEADTPQQLTTSYTPAFLGLNQPGGLWSQLNNTAKGEDIVVGIIDSGVWPENPAYADRVDSNGAPSFDGSATLAYGPAPAGWNGACESGEGFTAEHCNNKLIGARFFNTVFEQQQAGKTHWTEFRSPRDSVSGPVGEGSHGTHTSSTAAGNSGVSATANGIPMNGHLSGMAPRARVAVYKVCWSYTVPVAANEPNGVKNTCYGADSMAAIERAILDGVHVLNYSISGGTSYTDGVEQAFLNASNAGIFVAASAGNDGPANQVAHISPWLTTVAASTHGREMRAKATLGNGSVVTGSSLNHVALQQTALIRAQDAALPGADPAKAALCYTARDVDADAAPDTGAVLDPAKVAGKIVVCRRGTTARIDKGQAVKDAGGVGMILVNTIASGVGSELFSDLHVLPAVQLTSAIGAQVSAYAAGVGATAALDKFYDDPNAAPAPMMAGFSSRGPNRKDANLLKPDLTAPGVAILAGGSETMDQTRRDQIANGGGNPQPVWEFMQGTSMSSPHVAGLAALLRQLHPSWSPAAIKSALMTTGTMTVNDGLAGTQNGRLPWAQGAGHVNPNKAMDPGLVYDIRPAEYKRYMCGGGVATQCSEGTLAGYNLNLPSITIANVLGAQTVTRSVTNVGGAAATYTATPAISGYTMTVTPSTLSLEAGETKSFNVTLTRSDAADNVWQFGSLTWSDGVHNVRIPVQAASGRLLIAPAQVSSDRSSGTRALNVATGFTGKMGVAKGFKEVTRSAQNVAEAPAGTVESSAQSAAACAAGNPGLRAHEFSVPANTIAARFETFNRDVVGGSANDLDLVLVNGAGALVAYSGVGGSTESITLRQPAAGNYKLCVIGYQAANRVSSDYVLSSAIVTTADQPANFKVMAPSKVFAGSTATVTASWSGLELGKRYLGAVQYLDLQGAVADSTLLSLQTTTPIPEPEPAARAPRDTSL